jgi:anti-sigma B factor antagonist
MEIGIDRRGDRVAVVRLDGRLDLSSAPEFKEQIAAVVAGGAVRLVVDLAAVGFIDSSGLGALISGLKTARQASGDLRIANPNEQASMILQLTALERVLYPYPTLEEALAGY